MDNIKRVEMFFDYNMKIKKIMSNIFPDSMDFSTVDSLFDYQDRLKDNLARIELGMLKIMKEFNVPAYIIDSFLKKIEKKLKWSIQVISIT